MILRIGHEVNKKRTQSFSSKGVIMGRKGVSKRKPSQAKSKNPSDNSATSGTGSVSSVIERQLTRTSETGKPVSSGKSSSDWKKNSKKE
jgi:hypothetical protein